MERVWIRSPGSSGKGRIPCLLLLRGAESLELQKSAELSPDGSRIATVTPSLRLTLTGESPIPTRPLASCKLTEWKGIPLHATPLYSLILNLLTGSLLVHLWFCSMPAGLLTGLYFLLAVDCPPNVVPDKKLGLVFVNVD